MWCKNKFYLLSSSEPKTYLHLVNIIQARLIVEKYLHYRCMPSGGSQHQRSPMFVIAELTMNHICISHATAKR